MRILVTDGNSRSTLAITRSLGQAGHEVIVTSKAPKSIAACSRYCHEHHTYPDPALSRAEFVDSLVSLVEQLKIDVLLPVTDVCVLPVAEQRQRFEALCHLPLPAADSLDRAADKQAITTLAAELGVATPVSLTVAEPGQLDIDSLQIPYPVVLKPARSRVRTAEGWLYTGVDYADSARSLKRKLDGIPAAAYPVLLQERVSGPGIGLFYCFDNGRPVASFAHRRLREKPPSGGVSVLRESVPLNPQAHEYSLKLLGALNWHGVAMVEFKLDERDNTPKLMEINGRFWGSLQLAIDAGVDFPAILVRIASGETVAPIEQYRYGVRSRWLWGDVDLLLMFLLKSREELQLPAGHPNRLISILTVLCPWVPGQKLEILRLGDIKPWLHESLNWFRR
ncbi:carboxylate--amine ligase [Woeseia oceani]|uniref:ATP-grasp domain-containing protein n=1 Tax=Woeseia oceani TaxID=1548547 RepID=A0A193LEZ5_9GAMM|nr:ATP-grasp domain-containing protein [Woeseia oceani]ANO50954.1 hypothetical protein BA177_06800 [Woeseia oceani]